MIRRLLDATRRMVAVTSGIALLVSGAVLVVGLVITWQVGSAVRGDRTAQRTMLLDQRTALSRTAVDTEVHRHLDALRAVAGALGGYQPLTYAGFQAATSALPGSHLPGATSVAFVVPAADDRIGEVEALWRGRGSAGLRLQPEGTGREHFFSIMNRPLSGGAPVPTGIDLAQSAEPAGALSEARRSGLPTVSDPFVLIRDRSLPSAQRQLSFVLAAPVYGPHEFLGWVVMGLRGQDFVGATLHDVTQGVVDASLWATNGGGQSVRVAGLRHLSDADLFRSTTIIVANRAWRLEIAASSGALPVARNSGGIELTGAAITVLLTGLVWVLATGRARATAKVSVATRELRAAEHEAHRRLGLLNGILERISDGVTVVDERGEFLVHNPAANALLGVDRPIGGIEHWPEHYGIFRTDGTTPFPAADLPLIRAIAGEFVEDVELVVRNPAHPDGLLLSVNCRPFQIGEQRGAIAVFHDVTAIRDREADLQAFAGIVAHDLKNPLTVISAHAEMAQDALTEDRPRDAMRSIVAVSGGVERMRRLIDDLLAYTTARDAPLKMRTVDLVALVADVVAARIDHLPVRPDVYLGPLPDVEADPTMLRHVLDNLIGNALKYVPPGQTPRIDVSATITADDWVRIEVADRGIGVPDADKPHIFDSFHRAHVGGDYVGTGLGLAICRRIVDRHGGTIGVADNAGGGSRFIFTLPPATVVTPADPADPADPAAPDASWLALSRTTDSAPA